MEKSKSVGDEITISVVQKIKVRLNRKEFEEMGEGYRETIYDDLRRLIWKQYINNYGIPPKGTFATDYGFDITFDDAEIEPSIEPNFFENHF